MRADPAKALRIDLSWDGAPELATTYRGAAAIAKDAEAKAEAMA